MPNDINLSSSWHPFRSWITTAVLSIMTGGIYFFYWLVRIHRLANTLASGSARKRSTWFGMLAAILLGTQLVHTLLGLGRTLSQGLKAVPPRPTLADLALAIVIAFVSSGLVAVAVMHLSRVGQLRQPALSLNLHLAVIFYFASHVITLLDDLLGYDAYKASPHLFGISHLTAMLPLGLFAASIFLIQEYAQWLVNPIMNPTSAPMQLAQAGPEGVLP